MLERLRRRLLYLSLGVTLALTGLPMAGCSRTGEFAGDSAGTSHAPEGRATRGRLSADGADPEVSELDANALLSMELALWQTAGQTSSPRDVERLVRFYAHTNRYSEAITTLESAPFEVPAHPTTSSDLAVAYLERGAETGDPFDLLLAAETALEAVRLQPDLAEARYNFALSLDTLSLVRQAQMAWESYLELDTSSEWAAAARDLLFALESPPDQTRWATVVALLEGSGSEALDPALEQEILDLASHAYRYAESELFPRWADATLTGDETQAERDLEVADLLGTTLVQAGADGTISGAVEAIRAAQASAGPELLLELARGHLDLSQGVALRTQDCSSAVPLLESSEQRLLAGGDPYAHWATLYRTICRYGETPTLTLQELTELGQRIDGLSLPALDGRIDWMLGLAKTWDGDYAGALAPYQAARQSLATAHDQVGVAGTLAVLAEANQELGRPQDAWVQRLEGLDAVARAGEPKALIRALEEAVAALTEEGRLDLALLFSDELLARSEEFQDLSTAQPTTLWKHAMLLHRIGDDARASDALAAARSLAEARSSEPTFQAILTQIDAVQGLVSVSEAPGEAIALIGRALDETAAIGQESWHPMLLKARARAFLETGDLPSARADLQRAIGFVEEQRFSAQDELLRITFFETVQDLYDSMVALQARRLDDPEAAFEVADRSRSRGLLERVLGANDPVAASMPASDVARTLDALLPDGVAVLEYGLLEDELLLWVIDRDGLRLVRQAVSARELRSRVRGLLNAIERERARVTVDRVASELFEVLVRPVRGALEGVETVIIVPDRFLSQVPYGALYDRRTGRYWIEDQALAVAPSASLLAAAGSAERNALRERPTALVVANPTLDTERFPDLAEYRLAGAAREGRKIADLYPGAELLVGAAATPRALLASVGRHPVLHVGSHAVLNRRNPQLSVLALAPAPEAPHRGALTAEDLVAGDLGELELAFMAACTTAASFPGGEREGLAGFVRELLGAGIPAVVASLWEVDDAATSILAIGFHRELSAGADPIAALRAAQLGMLENPPDPLFRSPAYWAGFQTYVGRLPADL